MIAIRFLGENVECRSPQDAAALQRASDILTDLAPNNLNPDERADVTALLLTYGRYGAARDFRLRKLPAV